MPAFKTSRHVAVLVLGAFAVLVIGLTTDPKFVGPPVGKSNPATAARPASNDVVAEIAASRGSVGLNPRYPASPDFRGGIATGKVEPESQARADVDDEPAGQRTFDWYTPRLADDPSRSSARTGGTPGSNFDAGVGVGLTEDLEPLAAKMERLREVEKLVREGRAKEAETILKDLAGTLSESERLDEESHQLLDAGKLEEAAAKFRQMQSEQDVSTEADDDDAPPAAAEPLVAIEFEGNKTIAAESILKLIQSRSGLRCPASAARRNSGIDTVMNRFNSQGGEPCPHSRRLGTLRS